MTTFWDFLAPLPSPTFIQTFSVLFVFPTCSIFISLSGVFFIVWVLLEIDSRESISRVHQSPNASPQGCWPLSLTGATVLAALLQLAHHTFQWVSVGSFEFLLSSATLLLPFSISHIHGNNTHSLRLLMGFLELTCHLVYVYPVWCCLSFWICGLVLMVNLGKFLVITASNISVFLCLSTFQHSQHMYVTQFTLPSSFFFSLCTTVLEVFNDTSSKESLDFQFV